MTNQQLKAHCEDVIANPQDNLDWVVDMARVALASLEAVPVGWQRKDINALGTLWFDWSEVFEDMRLLEGSMRRNKAEHAKHRILFTAPPVPELKPIELPPKAPDDLHRVLDGYEKWLIATTFRDTWNACRDEVLRLNGVKS